MSLYLAAKFGFAAFFCFYMALKIGKNTFRLFENMYFCAFVFMKDHEDIYL